MCFCVAYMLHKKQDGDGRKAEPNATSELHLCDYFHNTPFQNYSPTSLEVGQCLFVVFLKCLRVQRPTRSWRLQQKDSFISPPNVMLHAVCSISQLLTGYCLATQPLSPPSPGLKFLMDTNTIKSVSHTQPHTHLFHFCV